MRVQQNAHQALEIKVPQLKRAPHSKKAKRSDQAAPPRAAATGGHVADYAMLCAFDNWDDLSADAQADLAARMLNADAPEDQDDNADWTVDPDMMHGMREREMSIAHKILGDGAVDMELTDNDASRTLEVAMSGQQPYPEQLASSVASGPSESGEPVRPVLGDALGLIRTWDSSMQAGLQALREKDANNQKPIADKGELALLRISRGFLGC